MKDKHIGSSFDSFLEEVGIKEEVEAEVERRQNDITNGSIRRAEEVPDNDDTVV